MKHPIYITHELIMEMTKIYNKIDLKNSNNDFVKINTVNEYSQGKYIVNGKVHLYGYKIAGNGPYSGFYDVINQKLYTKEYIKDATIIEHRTEFIYESLVKPKVLKK